jgi:nitrilase
MTHFSEFTVAVAQASPIFFDREASTEKACQFIREAAEKDAKLVAFGETWLPGYPKFAWQSGDERWWEAAAEYLENAVEIPSPTTDQLCATAQRAGIDVVIGVVERDRQTQGTVYCTLLFISSEGEILGRHRKLKPTGAERAVWGEGDAVGLQVYERPYGRISGLNCWEHNMVLPGYALMSQGTQIHIAAWPGRESKKAPTTPIWTRQLLLSRAFASQASCYVLLAAGLCLPECVPERFADYYALRTGDSCIIDPRGEVITGPAVGETILTATISIKEIRKAKMATDTGGHYSRPDILQLRVNRRPLQRTIQHPLSDSDVPANEASHEQWPTVKRQIDQQGESDHHESAHG